MHQHIIAAAAHTAATPAGIQHAISGIGNPFPGVLGALIVFVVVMVAIQVLKAIFT